MYADRDEAGEVLAGHLAPYAGRPDVVVLGLARGGVPVAAAVARGLRAPLDVIVVRKLGVPDTPEVAFGAIGAGGVVVHNESVEASVPAAEVDAVIERERGELTRREALYRRGREPLELADQVAIIVDDGLATGASARAAVLVARSRHAARVVLAVPVGAPAAVALLSAVADEVVCPLVPADFVAVGAGYDRFDQTTDGEVIALLR